MRKIAIIICICLLTISVGLLDVHNGNLDGFLLMLVGITCFVFAVVPPITFYLHVINLWRKTHRLACGMKAYFFHLLFT